MKDSLLYTQNNLDIEDIILYKFPNRYEKSYRYKLGQPVSTYPKCLPIWSFPQSNEWAI